MLEQGHKIIGIGRTLLANDMLYLRDLDFMAVDGRDFGQLVACMRGMDEQHPTYVEEPYGLSKWVLEQQPDVL